MAEIKFSFVKSLLAIRPNVMRYISKIAPPAEVEDIVQEAYVRLCQIEQKQHNNSGDKPNHQHSLLYTIAKNLALDHNKRSEVRLADSAKDESAYHFDETDHVYQKSVNHEALGHFCAVIRSMPKQCQKVFVLKKVYGFTQQEIAEELGISVKTVDGHVVSGMKRLKIHMDKDNKFKAQHDDVKAGVVHEK